MAFSDYKNVAQVQKEFNITYHEDNFVKPQPLELSSTFVAELAFSLENIDVFTSEASRTETIIFPILREVYKHYHQHYSLWIQKPLTYTDKLSGTPDYLVGTKSPLGKTVLETPLVVVVEAKKNDFEQGWGQCLAELVAAQKINNIPELPVYGVVTDGKLWEFGKLEKNLFTKNIIGYTLDNLPQLFGTLNFIFQAHALHKFQ